MHKSIAVAQKFIIQNIINSVWGKVLLMFSSPAIASYLVSITERIQPWLPFAYYIAIAIGIICALSIRLLILKAKRQKIESVSEENIVFSKIRPYCTITRLSSFLKTHDFVFVMS